MSCVWKNGCAPLRTPASLWKWFNQASLTESCFIFPPKTASHPRRRLHTLFPFICRTGESLCWSTEGLNGFASGHVDVRVKEEEYLSLFFCSIRPFQTATLPVITCWKTWSEMREYYFSLPSFTQLRTFTLKVSACITFDLQMYLF